MMFENMLSCRREVISGGLKVASSMVAWSQAGFAAAVENGTEQSWWTALDSQIRGQWTQGLVRADEPAIRESRNPNLLFLPFPYLTPTGAGSVFGYMYAWDTDFIARALLAHGLPGLVKDYILNYGFMIERFGYMPNANHRALLTRSQTPLIADTLWRYYLATNDRALVAQLFPLLQQCFDDYWCASHHRTPIGLATNRDLGDPRLDPALAAEAETGLDWTPIFGGDVRRCVPLITNSALVRYCDVLSRIAFTLGDRSSSESYARSARERSSLINKYCWNERLGVYLEYDHISGRQLPYVSDCIFWPLWGGIASKRQAQRIGRNIGLLEQRFGLSSTASAYQVHHPADALPLCRMAPKGITATPPDHSIGGTGPLQWMYPAGWAPSHLIAAEGLSRYGLHQDALRISSKYLSLMLRVHHQTGHLWEKYNVVDGGIVLPNARCGNIWMNGWSAAAIALLGRYVFKGTPLGPPGQRVGQGWLAGST